MKTLDFTAYAETARHLTDSELYWAQRDCSEAAKAADGLERAGVAVIKSGGYYRDELSVYAAEQGRRARRQRS